MALVFMDSFDHYATNDLLKKWDYIGGLIYGETEINYSSQRRSNTKYLRLYDHYIEKDIVDTVTGLDVYSFVVGFAGMIASSSGSWLEIRLRTSSRNTQICVYAGKDGKIKFYVGSNLIEETPQNSIDMNTWFHLETKVFIHPTAGTYEVRLNEVTVLQGSGLNTQANSGEGIAKIFLNGGDHLVGSGCIDDFFFLDGNPSDDPVNPNNDFLGDSRIDVIYPDSPGTYSQFTPSAGANWENVDDPDSIPMGGDIDDDSTYNESNNVGNKDSYNHDSVIALGTPIFAAAQNSCVRKTDAGRRYIKQLIRSGGVDYLRDTEYYLTDFYKVTQRPLDVDPDTDLAWTEAKLNSVESGIEITV